MYEEHTLNFIIKDGIMSSIWRFAWTSPQKRTRGLSRASTWRGRAPIAFFHFADEFADVPLDDGVFDGQILQRLHDVEDEVIPQPAMIGRHRVPRRVTERKSRNSNLSPFATNVAFLGRRSKLALNFAYRYISVDDSLPGVFRSAVKDRLVVHSQIAKQPNASRACDGQQGHHILPRMMPISKARGEQVRHASMYAGK